MACMIQQLYRSFAFNHIYETVAVVGSGCACAKPRSERNSIFGRIKSSSQPVRHVVTEVAHMSMDSRKSRLPEKEE